jgi:RHS repeat-associated protein
MLKLRLQFVKLLPFLLVAVVVSRGIAPLRAQSTPLDIAYGETQSAVFADSQAHEWQFTGATRDMVAVRVQRISGQFIPVVVLLAADGQELASSAENAFVDTAELILAAGLPADGQFVLRVSGGNLLTNPIDNPDEYALTLLKTGQRKANLNDGLNVPLPAVLNARLPDILVGTPNNDNVLEIPIYGDAVLDRPNARLQPNRFTLTLRTQEVVIQNASPSPVNPVVEAVSFLPDGIGAIVKNDRLEERRPLFFADQNFEIAYDSPNRVWTFRLANEQTIITDFDRIEAILALQNNVVVIFGQQGDIQQKAIFDGNLIDIRRRRIQPSTEAPITEIRLEDGRYINTDLRGMETLAYLDGQLRVLYGADMRFISDIVALETLIQNPLNPQFYDVVLQNPVRNEFLNITYDLAGMGDIAITDTDITITPLDGRRISERLVTTRRLLLEQAGVRIERADTPNIFRLSLPDGTEVETPAPISNVALALPHEVGYVPRGFNNLGVQPQSLCACLQAALQELPVNPANGNFHYAVNDFAIPSHTLALEWTRYYNSLDAAGAALTPAYMLAAPHGYGLQQLGKGWRHSYQYELDITNAPLDKITLILPDGGRHLFTAQAPGATRFVSPTLLAWVIDRTGGILGNWHATRSDGIQYFFDRAGRLQRIAETPQRSLSLIPAPNNYTGEHQGFFVVEPYGRRLEIYTGTSGRIERVRDTLLREITYTFNGHYLTGVQYIHPDYTAQYTYNPVELLETYDDVRSPYTQTGRLGYDGRSRVIIYVENPIGIERQYRYEYDLENPFITRRIQPVAGIDQQWAWEYMESWQLRFRRLPGDNNLYEEFVYNENNIFAGYRPVNRALFQYRFDARGNLIRMEDPSATNDGDEFILTYEQRGDTSLLTRLQYPGEAEDLFTYTSAAPPQLQSHQRLVQTGNSAARIDPIYQETRYEYDAWGRVIFKVAPGSDATSGIGTVYVYDAFGYPAEIWQGIRVTPEDTHAEITPDRAQRILRLQHDVLGQLRAVTDGRGSLFTLNYVAHTGKLREVTAPQGVQLHYEYDSRGNIIVQHDRGQITQYEYDAFDALIRMTNAEGATTTYAYDAAGRQIATTDAIGRVTRYDYDAWHQLAKITSPGNLITTYTTQVNIKDTQTDRWATLPNGREILWRYDALNRIRNVVIIENNVEQDFAINYNPAGLPIEISSNATRRTLLLRYNAAGWLTATTIAGLTTRYEYDLAGNVIKITTPGEHTTTIAYDALGNVTQVGTAEGTHTRTFAYDAEHNPISQSDAAGVVTRYVYDALNQLVTMTDANANETQLGYDVRGNLIQQRDPLGNERTWQYNALDQIITVNAASYQSQYRYDAVGRLLSVTQPEGFTLQGRTLSLSYDIEDNIIASNITPGQLRTLYNYDVLKRLTSTTDPKGHTTVYTYNNTHQLSQIIDALGNSQQYAWRNNRLETYTDAENNAYTYTRDDMGRLTRITDNTGETPTIRNADFFYSPDGYLTEIVVRPSSVTNLNNAAIRHRYEYDSHGHVLRYIDPLGSVWRFEYDNLGRRSAVIDPAGGITRYRYDTVGQIVAVIHHADTELQTIEAYTYDLNGNIITYTSPAGIVNTYEYDANKHLIRATLADGTESAATYAFVYNGQGQLLQQDDPNRLRTCYFYRLDKLRRVEVRLSPAPTACEQPVEADEKIEYSYVYDDAGNLVSITLPTIENRPAVINFAYDALNRLVRYVDPTASVWSYTYDRVGNLRQISDPSGNTTDYEYNSYYQVTRVIFPTLADVLVGYDANGNLNTIRLPQTDANSIRQTLTYTLDAAGNLTEIRGDRRVRQFEYDANRRVIARLEANDRVTCYQYDIAGQLIATIYQNRPPCGSGEAGTVVRYGYDVAGNLITVEPDNGDSITMTYDARNRLKTFQQGGVAIAYDYDVMGNLVVRTAGEAGTTRYTYNPLHQLVRIELDEAFVTLNYDSRGQITDLTRSNGVVTRYTYDAAGHIVNLTHFDANERRLDGFIYQYDGGGNLIVADRVSDGWRMLYSYDVMNRLIDERWLNNRGETVYTLNIRYDAAGNRTEVIRDGVRTLYQYNKDNQLISATYTRDNATAALPLPGFFILVGLVGIVPLARRARVRSSVWVVWVFGLAIPLIAQTNPAILRAAYTYDVAGNLQTIDYIYIAPIVDANGVILLAPDGNPRTRETSYQLVFEYDTEQRLIAVTGQDEQGNPVNLNLSYDPLFSRPTTWVANDASYRLYYDGNVPLALENTAQANSTEKYLYLSPQERLLTITNTGEAIWHLNDVTHTPRRFVNAAGELLAAANQSLEFNGFGERIYPYPEYPAGVEAEITQVMPLFAGQLFDPATGYTLMGLRVYDPVTARFIQPDPLRQDIYGTLYTYAQNRPLRLHDATGMTAEPYLAPTQIIPDAAQLRPESLIPQPYQPDLLLPTPTTAAAQKDEFFRAWQLIDLTRYGINDIPLQLTPMLDELYFANLNPLPARTKATLAPHLQATMPLYAGGQGWFTTLIPDPQTPKTPYAFLQNLDPLLAQAQKRPLAFWHEANFYTAPSLMPSVTLPSALSEQQVMETTLLERLQPLSLLDNLLPEVENLAQIPTLPLVMPPALGAVTLPDIPIEPPLLTELEALRDQQQAFYERILNTGIYTQN